MSRTSKYAHPHPKDEQNQYLVVIIDHNCRLVIVQYSDSNQPRWKHKIWVQEGKLALIQWTIAVALASIARNFCVVEWHTKGRAKDVKSAVGLCFSCLLPTRTRMHPHAHTHTRTHAHTRRPVDVSNFSSVSPRTPSNIRTIATDTRTGNDCRVVEVVVEVVAYSILSMSCAYFQDFSRNALQHAHAPAGICPLTSIYRSRFTYSSHSSDFFHIRLPGD